MKNRQTTIDDKAALRAFVMPELFPFLLDSYIVAGKDEIILRDDIKKARECYKQIVASEKQKSPKSPKSVFSKSTASVENSTGH